MHKNSLGDMEILNNHCVVVSQCLRLCKQNLHQIIHPSITNHCVGVQVSDTQIIPCYFRAGNNIADGSNRGGR